MLRLLLCFLFPAALLAADRLVVDDDVFIEKCTEAAKTMRKEGKLVTFSKLRAQMATRHACELTLPEPNKDKLDPPDLYEMLRGSTVVVASFFKCLECHDWHFESSTGFVTAEGVVSTCHHVVQYDDKRMKDGYLVVADSSGKVYAVTEVLADNKDADTCLLRVPELKAKPLPLSANTRVGERAYCLSHPDGNHWMFTNGMVSRYFINREDADTGETLKPSLYVNVTVEYSPGSSGAPVVDECGNVIGQVESITASLEEEEGSTKGSTVTTSYGMPIRSCVASEEIGKLVRKPAPAVAAGEATGSGARTTMGRAAVHRK